MCSSKECTEGKGVKKRVVCQPCFQEQPNGFTCAFCSRDFKPVDEKDPLYDEQLKKYNEQTYMCNAKIGTRLADDCHKEMTYKEYYKHAFEHHKKRLYKCTLCNYDGAYETKDELKEEHWKWNCHASIFHPIYRLCKVCGIRL